MCVGEKILSVCLSVYIFVCLLVAQQQHGDNHVDVIFRTVGKCIYPSIKLSDVPVCK